MPTQCTFEKPNGTRCKAKALWGSDPPRCVTHRQDSGPTPPPMGENCQFGRLNATHGFYRRPLLPLRNAADEAAELLIKHERLAALITAQPGHRSLANLYRLYGKNLDHLVDLLQRYHETTGHHPDTLLRRANGRPKARLQARYQQLCRIFRRQLGPTYPTTSCRSPRYWLIYDYLLDYVKQHQASPTLVQIKQACHITSNHVVNYWLDRLEQDGRIQRLPHGYRNIRLPGLSPVQLELPLPPDQKGIRK